MIKTVLLLLMTAAPLMAQSDRAAMLDDRVRVLAPVAGYPKVVGRVVGTTPDVISVEVDRSKTEVAIARDQIQQLFLSTGQRRHTAKGVILGGGIGLIGTILFGPKAPSTEAPGISAGRGSSKNLAIGGVGGAALGGLIGYVTQTDSWVEIRHRFAPR